MLILGLRVQVARRALYEALGQGEEEVKQRLKMLPAEDGIVVGDETRLRQIITNLARFVLFPTPLSQALVAV